MKQFSSVKLFIILILTTAVLVESHAADPSPVTTAKNQTPPSAGSASSASVGATKFVDSVLSEVTVADLRRYHELITTEPHVAGTDGDVRQIERIRQAFESMGLVTRVEPFRCLLSRPISAQLEIVDDVPSAGTVVPPAAAGAPPARRGVVALSVREDNLLQDPATAHPDLSYGWNAYSGSGDVTAPVVYANYGTREDFNTLQSLGIEVKGKIVIARYGRCFRGLKARVAQERGAVGLILYTDPADSGFTKGKVWPDGGGWANDGCIQRGTVNTLPYPGDPGTPGVFAASNVTRTDPAGLDLPAIPVQPIGYAAAGMILARFQSADVPESWRGGLSLPYRFESGAGWKVHLAVQQQRFIGSSANVIATLAGENAESESVIVGCHHDAWGFGAADPGAGTMCLLETAKSFAAAAKKGHRPRRGMVFAAWGAEEFGIIGSTEWCEGHARELREDAVLYINLDMAAMGAEPGLAVSPGASRVAVEAAAKVPAAADASMTVHERLVKREGSPPLLGKVAGGSDHIAFVCWLGIPSISISAHGAPGTSYHSNYDTVGWYRATVGEGYEGATMVTKLAIAAAGLAAQSPLTSWSLASFGTMGIEAVGELLGKTKDPAMRNSVESLLPGFVQLETRGAVVDEWITTTDRLRFQDEYRLRNGVRKLQRAFLSDEGLRERPWFRNMLLASDRDDGYGVTTLPAVAEAIADGDQLRLDGAVFDMIEAQQRAIEAMELIERAAPKFSAGQAP